MASPAPVLDDDGEEDFGDLRSFGYPIWLNMAAALAASAVMVIGAIALLNHRSQQLSVRSNTAVAQSEAWIAANLPAGTRLLTDETVKWDLAIRAPLLLTSSLWEAASVNARVDYVVSTPSLRAVSGLADPALNSALQDSVPVALFGSGPDQVAVGQISSADRRVIESRRALDVDSRRMAGRGLLANPRIHAERAAAVVLNTGGLDMRAATVLASLAGRTGIRLLSLPIDPAEAAANMPGRIVALIPAEPKELAALLAALPPVYRPQSVHLNPDGSSTLTWMPMVDPIPPAT